MKMSFQTSLSAQRLKYIANLGRAYWNPHYEKCLAYELGKQNIDCECQKQLPVKYKEIQIDTGY